MPNRRRPPGQVHADLTLREITPELEPIDEPLLRGVHGLLVSAHYRTRPSDARTLLDGPNMRTWVAEHQHQVIAVVMVAEEESAPGIVRCDYRRPAPAPWACAGPVAGRPSERR
ncbi:MAG: hypothetical protein R3F38_12535 [Gammaproteobacteria bacterium]